MTTTTTDPSSPNYRAPGPQRGGNVVHAVIEGLADSSKGLEVAIRGDAGWSLITQERQIGVRSSIRLNGEVVDTYVEVRSPIGFTSDGPQTYEEADGWPFVIEEGSDPTPEVPEGPITAGIPATVGASATVTMHTGISGRVIVSRTEGADGNDWAFQYSFVDFALTDGIQLTTSPDNADNPFIQILVQTGNSPTVQFVINTINARGWVYSSSHSRNRCYRFDAIRSYLCIS